VVEAEGDLMGVVRTFLHSDWGWTKTLIRSCVTILGITVLTWIYGPSLISHFHNSANPFIFNDDARAWIVPFVVTDYATEYHWTLLPIGFKAFYQIVAFVADPVAVSKVLPYFLLFAVVGGVWAAAGQLGGVAASISAAALCLSSGVFLDLMAGGLPRAFAFPLVAAAAVALILGRTLWLAAIVVISSAFYPPVAVVTGLALSFEALTPSAPHRKEPRDWTIRHRIVLVAATALCAGLILMPGFIAKGYGPRVTSDDLAAYPEAGPDGRYGMENRADGTNLWIDLRQATRETLKGAGQPWSYRLHAVSEKWDFSLDIVVLVLTTFGLGSLAVRTPAARRLLLLIVAAIAAHTAAHLFAPYLYLPQRYVVYTIPILIVVGLPIAAGHIATLFRRLPGGPWMPSVATLAITAGCLALLGGHGDEWGGLTVDHRKDARVFEFLTGLPDRAVVAGWPDGGIIDSVPYITRHPAFMTYETHQAFHRGYLDHMRYRMHALIDAVFAIDALPLVNLRDACGVTYLIVDRRYYGSSPPTYFEPFDAWIRAAEERGRIAGFEVPRQFEAATVFSQGTLVVLDLRKLAVPSGSGHGL
jgi:hypothetical protein